MTTACSQDAGVRRTPDGVPLERTCPNCGAAVEGRLRENHLQDVWCVNNCGWKDILEPPRHWRAK